MGKLNLATLKRAKREAVERFLRPAKRREFVTTLALTSVNPQVNVVGIGIGTKVTDGKATATPCVRLYVERKLSRLHIAKKHLIPAAINGVDTDVVETGLFSILPSLWPVEQSRLRPAQPGCSVGFQFPDDSGMLMAGTFGAVVQDGDGTLYVLSNNHVLANENRLPLGSPIMQPGLLDGGGAKKDTLATLSKFIARTGAQYNSVDAAIAKVSNPALVSPVPLPKVGKLATGEPISAVEKMAVCKVGRTSGYTEGTITDVDADVSVGYQIGNLLFSGQIVVERPRKPFSREGDSGALVVDKASRRPVALLFAGSDTHALANPIHRLLGRVGISMVTKLSGLILSALAAQIIFTGIRNLLKG